MALTSIDRELQRVGRTVRRWNAQLRLTIAAAALLGVVSVFGAMDLLLQFGRLARVSAFLTLLAAAGVSAWWLLKAVRQPLTTQGVAASLERAFPELDNHLINYVQFAAKPAGDVFKNAYIKRGIAGWAKVRVGRMKNRRVHRWSLGALCAAVIVTLAPALLTGRPWGVALWRVANPFSGVQPLSLTRVLAVRPGTTTSLQGEPLVLSCAVAGRRGHRVLLDVEPADGEAATYMLGEIAGDPEESFSHRISMLTTVVRYRFRAGDAPFPEWFQVTPRPPLAFTSVQLAVTPPLYTGIDSTTIDGLAGGVEIPEGSRVALRVSGNAPIKSASATLGDAEPLALLSSPEARSGASDTGAWLCELTFDRGASLKLGATDTFGDTVETKIDCTLVPDRPPVIKVVSPTGRATLPAGADPAIDLVVTDDYGLLGISLERVAPGGPPDAAGATVKQWTPSDPTAFAVLWSEPVDRTDGGVLAFRVVTSDNCSYRPHTACSETILFNAAGLEDAGRERDKQDREASATLGKLIQMQRENIGRTRAGRSALDSATAGQWEETAAQQRRVRLLTRRLLTAPGQPLGNLTATAKRLYANEMAHVIDTLSRIPAAQGGTKATLATRALNMEEKILRQLTYADVAVARARVEQRVSAISGLLAALVRGETQVLKTTQEYVKTAAQVGTSLVDRQDDLAADLTDFVAACRREASTIADNDRAFSSVLTDLAARCERTRIRDDMTLAAEDLDRNQPADAVPHEQHALAKLKDLQERLANVETAAQEAREEEMLDVLEHAHEKLRKVRELHQHALASMEMVKDQHDADEKRDLMEEEYQELLKNTKEVLLTVPTDLHVFMELNVANDLVEDVFSIFEEVEEKELPTSDGEGGEVTEKAYAKREELLGKMEEMEGRFDKLEEWLGEKAENDVITTEAFDQEEMPEGGIALGALAAEAEDLIGDLLEDAEEGADRAKDGATNHAVPDDPGLGWEVKEGDLTSFAAKGKSGNQVPDHKEQDGRSNVGRQGMAVGENASGSGTIGEGDGNIEARRTQDPTQAGQVDLDGEAETRATGGGKQASGKADEEGMAGGTRRMDSTEAGSVDGLEALMAKRADAMYAKASLKNVRADSLRDAAHHLRQAADAVATGQPIQQVKELRKRAVASLRKARTQLEAGRSATLSDGLSTSLLDGVVDGDADEAPPRYRELVADYYKKLNEAL